MADQINSKLESHWAEIFAEAIKTTKSVSTVTREDPASHGDPPDAVYRLVHSDSSVSYEWAELTGIYPSSDAARIVFKEARGVPDGEESSLHKLKRVDGMNDFSLAQVAHSSILKKISKDSYQDLAQNFGPGHLVLFLPRQSYPLLDSRTAWAISNDVPIEQLAENRYFKTVSLLYKEPDSEDGLLVHHLPDSQSGYALVELWKNTE